MSIYDIIAMNQVDKITNSMENHKTLDRYLETGKNLIAPKKYDEAIALYQEALTFYPDHAILYRELGFVQEKIGDFPGEIISYQKAIELEPQQPIWVYKTLAELLKKENRFQDSLKVYQKATEIYPENALFYRELGVIQEKIGDFRGQLKSYQTLVKLDEQQPSWVYLVLGKLLRENKDFYPAISIYQKAIKLAPENAELYRELAFTQEKIADFEGEKFNYQKSIDLNPNQPRWVYSTLGDFLENEENWTELIILYHQSRKIHPSLTSFLDKISRQIWQNAIALLEQTLNLQPDQADLYIKLGQLYEDINPEKAIENYQKAKIWDCNNINSYLNLAHIFNQKNRLEDSLDNYKKGLELAKNERDRILLENIREKIYQKFNYLEIIKNSYLKILSVWEILEKEKEFAENLAKLKQEIREYYGFSESELSDNLADFTEGENLSITEKIDSWETRLKQIKLINDSGVFNLDFYQGKKAGKMKLEIINEYLETGYLENPHPLFNTYYYLNQPPKITETNLNPLIHFCQKGWQQKRNPHPLFDTSYYLKNNPDIIINPLQHYLEIGVYEGKNPHPLFDTSYYLKNNPDLTINPLQHFLEIGVYEGKNPHPFFDTSYYLKNNPDLTKIEINPLQHFLEIGFSKNNNPHPLFSLKNYRDYLTSINQPLKSTDNPLINYLENDQGFSRFACFPWQFEADSFFDQKGHYDILILVKNDSLFFLDLITEIRKQKTDLNFWIIIFQDEKLTTEFAKYGLTFSLSKENQQILEILTSFQQFTSFPLVICNNCPEIGKLCQTKHLPFLDILNLAGELFNNTKKNVFKQNHLFSNTFILQNNNLVIQSIIDQLQNKYDYFPQKELKISVIIPNYNSEKFIKQRLETIINQTEKPDEIIFLDDNSKDNSLEIGQKILAKSNIFYQIITNKKNTGTPFQQWVKGIKHCTGDLIWIAESDDYCDLQFLKKLKPQFYENDVVLAYCQSKPVDLEGKILAENYRFYTDEIDQNKWNNHHKNDGINEIKQFLSVKNTIPNASAVLMRKSAISEETLLNIQKYRFAGDWFMYLSILTQGKIAFIAQPLNYHRQHEQTVTRKIQRKNSYTQEIIDVKKYINEIESQILTVSNH